MAILFTKRGTPPSLGKRASDYEVGDIVKIPVNGTNTDFLVVHQGNPSASIYDSSCNGTWLLMKDCYELKSWGTYNNNSYADSTINSYLNDTIYNIFSSSAQNAIKQVKIPYRPSNGTSKTCNIGTNGLNVKVFLLSCVEVGFNESYQPTNEGSKLDYFESGTGTSANNKRIANYNGSPQYGWHLRSPSCYSGYNTYMVNPSGQAYNGYNATMSSGIRPAVIIDFNTKFDPDTNIIL